MERRGEMPKFLEDKLKKEYPGDDNAVYGTMQAKHDAEAKPKRTNAMHPGIKRGFRP